MKIFIFKEKVFTAKLIIIDSFVDLRLFTLGKTNILNRAAVIPIEEYAELLQAAERFEKLAILKPLANVIDQREVQIMQDAAYDEEKGRKFFKK